VVLPLEPLTLVHCRWEAGGGTYYPARIVDRRPVEGSSDQYSYYVHYRGFNRRMDEWVELEDLDLDTVIPREPVDPNDPK